MKKKTDVKGMIKDYLKGIITGAIALVCIILGIVFISDPNGVILAIILFGVGVGFAGTSFGLIAHAKKINTYAIGESSSGPSADKPRSHRKPEEPTEKPTESVSQSAVLRAVRNLSYGQVRVANAYVSEVYPNEFNIELTLRNTTGEDDMLESHANAVIDEARRAVERLGASANISAHF